MSSDLGSAVNSTLSSVSPSLPPGSSVHTLWMSADLVWTLFFVLLALSMLVSLRFDWLRVWWLDQWRHLADTSPAEDPLTDAVSLPRSLSSSVPQSVVRSVPRSTSASRPPHRPERSHAPLPTPAGTAQRPLFHRSGRRH